MMRHPSQGSLWIFAQLQEDLEFPEGSTARQPEEFPHVVPGLPRLPFQLDDVLLFGGDLLMVFGSLWGFE